VIRPEQRVRDRTDVIEVEGIVIDVHRGDLYAADCTGSAIRRNVLARRAGKFVKNFVRVIAGDGVRLEISAYSLGKPQGRVPRGS
jgi:translation initiation factor IF-1